MKVKDLKEMFIGLDDEMDVYIPSNSEEFDGRMYSPCVGESGVSQISDMGPEDEWFDEDEFYPERDIFLLAPHGYCETEKDHSHELN